ncbi:TPA: hypothetical protein ACGO6P_002008 [Streptococcus suis]
MAERLGAKKLALSSIHGEKIWNVFLPFVKSIKVFDEKYFVSRNPNKEIILFWTKV